MSTKSPITTHILDLGSGHPAAGVSVSLFKIQGGNENLLAEGTTNDDGRITDWFDNPVEMGHYRLTFDIGTWYQERGLDTFFPQVSLCVCVYVSVCVCVYVSSKSVSPHYEPLSPVYAILPPGMCVCVCVCVCVCTMYVKIYVYISEI